ncbi:MAG: VanZ family protein [Armatimonadota bacterium]
MSSDAGGPAQPSVVGVEADRDKSAGVTSCATGPADPLPGKSVGPVAHDATPADFCRSGPNGPARASRRAWVVVAVYAAGILIATSVPIPPGLPAPKDSDKLAHFIMYAGLGALFLRAWLLRPPSWEQRGRLAALSILVTVVCCCVFGAVDEWHQQFVGRGTSFADWVADVIGVVIGTLSMVAPLLRRRTEARSDAHV